MPVQRQVPVVPGTYGEGRESGIAGACRDRDAVAMPVVRTTQPANDTKRRDYRQRTKGHRARGLADQQTSGHELRAEINGENRHFSTFDFSGASATSAE